MGWVAELHGRIVGLDTAPLIYYMADNAAYTPMLTPFFEAFDHGALAVVTSAVHHSLHHVQLRRRVSRDS